MGTLVGIMPLGCIAVLEGAMACETPCRGLLGELWIIPRSRRRLTAWSDMGWLLPQGDRFGGALDAAAKMFSKAFDSGIIPMEFVNKMKKEDPAPAPAKAPRLCPYCRMEIADDATRCGHCTSPLD